jgi:G3E family GTPase
LKHLSPAQDRGSSARIPLFLITGFLGSGKTTFLQHLLSDATFPRASTALLINDAGPMNVDAKVFKGQAEAVRALTGGCACCLVSKDLQREIRLLAKDPRIKQIWIEASGVAEVEDLLDRLTEDDLPQICSVQRVIHLVDAFHYGRSLFSKALQHAQWRWAEVVILNKSDLVKPQALQSLQEKVRQVHPHGQVLSAVRGQIQEKIDWIKGGERLQIKAGLLRLPHALKLSTCWLEIPHPVKKERLLHVLQQLPEKIYRVKGWVRFQESPAQQYLVHKVGAGNEEIQLWPYEREENETGLVFLGVQLEESFLREQFASL